MVRWFVRSELRLVSSRKDRAVDHRSLEDVVVVLSHGTDHCSRIVCISPCQGENLQSCDPADTE